MTECIFVFFLLTFPPDCKQGVVSDYCAITVPIKASRKDTDGTLRQVLRENAKYRDLCAKPLN